MNTSSPANTSPYMKSIKFRIALLYLFVASCCLTTQAQQRMTYVMDMVHNNPGEAPYVTKYNDGAYLASQGYNSVVTHWHINCAVTYDSFKRNTVRRQSSEREWIEHHAQAIRQKLDSLKQAGLEVYPFTDFLVFPKSVWDKYGDDIQGLGSVAGDGHSGNRTRRVNIQSAMTQKLLRTQIDEIFTEFPQLDGLVIRFGETYLQDTPYHMGGSPISDANAIDDHVLFLNILREEVCVKRGKKVFYRTWDFGYRFHCNPEFYLQVTDRVEPHPLLLFSIKYQQGDFHRNCPFNPTIGIGQHRQVIECQARMEAYGKAAHPYYTASGVIDGWPETQFEIDWADYRLTRQLRDPQKPRGLKDVLATGLVDGMMTWSHGGGWQGPYIKHEIWTNLNCYVLTQWSLNTSLTEEEIFYRFARLKGFDTYNANLFRQIALLSIEAVRKGQLNSYTANQVWWARDEFFSVRDNREVIREIHQKGLEEKVLQEKREAVALWEQIEAISRQLENKDRTLLDAIRVSCTYGRIKYELIEQMWIMMLNYAPDEGITAAKRNLLADALKRYDALWQEWRTLYREQPLCATLYTDLAFRNNEKGSIQEFTGQLREALAR